MTSTEINNTQKERYNYLIKLMKEGIPYDEAHLMSKAIFEVTEDEIKNAEMFIKKHTKLL